LPECPPSDSKVQGLPEAGKTPFDWAAVWGEWQLSLILAGIWGLIRVYAAWPGKVSSKPSTAVAFRFEH
jgi:hypothetical protein